MEGPLKRERERERASEKERPRSVNEFTSSLSFRDASRKRNEGGGGNALCEIIACQLR